MVRPVGVAAKELHQRRAVAVVQLAQRGVQPAAQALHVRLDRLARDEDGLVCGCHVRV